MGMPVRDSHEDNQSGTEQRAQDREGCYSAPFLHLYCPVSRPLHTHIPGRSSPSNKPGRDKTPQARPKANQVCLDLCLQVILDLTR